MTNTELSALFERIANLLDISGEQGFRVNAYHRAARVVKDLPKDVAAMLAEGSLAEVDGIGKGMLEKIEQYVRTGKIDKHEELAATVPAGLPALLDIPGMGPKKVAIVWKELGVETLEALKQAIASGAAAKLKGFGEKSVAQIMAGMEFAAKATERTPLGVAWPLAQAVVEQVRALPGVKRVEIAGSLRRALETIGDVDILCEAKDGQPVIDAFTTLPGVARVLAAGDTK